jgi:acyl carrier protein
MASTPSSVVVVSHALQDVIPGNAIPLVPAASSPARAAAPESGDVEATLAFWWKELLGVEQVGLDDDFFALGGHSLVGVRLLAKIKRTYRVDLQLAVLFESSTVRQLAEVVRNA